MAYGKEHHLLCRLETEEGNLSYGFSKLPGFLSLKFNRQRLELRDSEVGDTQDPRKIE